MWISFKPIKDQELVLKIVDSLIKFKPVKVHKTKDGWIISVKLKSQVA